MLLFRSEEHVENWLRQWRLPRGAVIPLDQCWRLAAAWYGPDRRAPDWRRKTLEEAEALYAEIGLEGAFWRLRPAPQP